MIKISRFQNNKYKDELPENTINRIRNILNEVGIFTIEENWKNSTNGFCSVTVKIPNTNLQTNGKGTTHKYALASGYAELMERLQNQAQFRLSIDVSLDALKYKGFYYAPDEDYLNIYEFMDRQDYWTQYQLNTVSSDIDKKVLLEKWASMSNENMEKDFVALPYININDDCISMIPVKMVSKMYMSNGMCSGNTIEEALVQGLSEVFERAVNKDIITKKLTPPTIPRYYIEKYPRLKQMISDIESSGNFEIIVKDCSLGKGYPVTGVIFMNKDNQTYFIKFGAHPKFEIALERTLTELLQGQNIKNMMGVKEFQYLNEKDNDTDNLMGILVNGSGHYPKELFDIRASYEFNGFEEVEEQENKEMLKYLIKILKNDGYNVLVRDVSYLGFPSYHIIVPGFSEIEKFNDIKSLDKYLEYSEVKQYLRNFDNLKGEEIDKVIKHLEKYDGNGSIVQLLNLKTKGIFPWYYLNTGLFLGTLYFKKKCYKKSYTLLNNYVKKYSEMLVNNSSYNKMINSYYRCARDFIGAHIHYTDIEEIIDYLKNIYPINIINGVITDFGDKENMLSQYGNLKCWNCNECRLKNHCTYDSVEEVYKLLKDRYFINQIDQSKLKGLLDY